MKLCKHPNHEGDNPISIDMFHRDKTTPDGRRYMCKTCAQRDAKAWRAERAKDPKWRKKFNDANTVSRKKGGKVQQLYCAAMERARKKGIEFNITKDDIVIPEVCPVLGIKIKAGTGRSNKQPSSPSIDRIDNAKGYVKGNVVVMSWRANYLKNTGTLEELVLLGEFAKQHLAH